MKEIFEFFFKYPTKCAQKHQNCADKRLKNRRKYCITVALNHLFKIKDSNKRNILQLACHYGRHELFLYLISMVIVARREGIFDEKFGKSLILDEDANENNILEIVSVHGYSTTYDQVSTFDRKCLTYFESFFR